MATVVKILAFAGSLRKESYNKKLIRVGAGLAREAGAEVTLVDLAELPLPLFDGDLEDQQGLPANARILKDLFLAHQGLLLACPEYNSSITGVLKNTIDWVSRPVPGEAPLQCFAGKVAGLLAASPGGLGGLRGLVTVRSILSNIKVLVLPEQVAIAKAPEAFTASGELREAAQVAALGVVVRRLVEVVGKLQAT